MRSLAIWSAKNAFLAIMICLGIIAGGGYAAKNLVIDAVPDLTNIQVQVVTRAAALSATEVESQITQPIERGMQGGARELFSAVQTQGLGTFGLCQPLRTRLQLRSGCRRRSRKRNRGWARY